MGKRVLTGGKIMVTIKISKTVQVRQYEPMTVSIEHSFEVESFSTKKRQLLIEKEYNYLKDFVHEKINELNGGDE